MGLRRASALLVAFVLTQGAAPIPARASATAVKCAPLTLPRDDRAHPGSRNEWWRVLAHLRTASGQRYDAFVTIAKFPGTMPATATLIDVTHQHMTYASRVERDRLALADASRLRLDVHVGDWRVNRDASGNIEMRVTVGGASLAIAQTPEKAAVAYDDAPACAYAYTRMNARGTLVVGGVATAVTGESWLDHEYASTDLGFPDVYSQRFAVQFDDGRDLLLVLREKKRGRSTLHAAGILVAADGHVQQLGGDFRICNAMTTTFTSASTHFHYPSVWEIVVPRAGLDLAVVPPLPNQELASADLSNGIYAGALEVESAPPPDRFHGQGFVELTGHDVGAALRGASCE
jgi:predicted secreted hydrolase